MPIERPLEQGRNEAEVGSAAPEVSSRSTSGQYPDMHPDTASGAATGIALRRHFVPAGVNPYDEVEWDVRSAVIQGEGGEIVFEQRDVEMPRGVVAARDQRRRVEVLPRSARHAAARAQRPAADRSRRQHASASGATRRATSPRRTTGARSRTS